MKVTRPIVNLRNTQRTQRQELRTSQQDGRVQVREETSAVNKAGRVEAKDTRQNDRTVAKDGRVEEREASQAERNAAKDGRVEERDAAQAERADAKTTRQDERADEVAASKEAREANQAERVEARETRKEERNQPFIASEGDLEFSTQQDWLQKARLSFGAYPASAAARTPVSNPVAIPLWNQSPAAMMARVTQ